MIKAMRTAATGMVAQQMNVDNIANNLSNVNTTGFKKSRAEFGDVYAVSFAGVSNNAVGGGVRLAQVAQDFSQGNVEFTNNSLDLAMNGEGFFVVEDNGGRSYTRAGAFSVDRDGFVVNSSGAKLKAFSPIDTSGTSFNTGSLVDLQLTLTEGAPNATESVTAAINLDSDSTPLPTGTPMDPLVDPTSFSYSTSYTVYDSLGSTHTATLYFKNDDSAANYWKASLYVDDVVVPVGGADEFDMAFNSDGSLDLGASAGTNGVVAFDTITGLPNGATDINLTLGFGEMTQYGSTFSVNTLTQDGYATGRLTGLDISDTGVVSARYTNGQAQALGKLALASFPNPGGLRQLGDTGWSESFAAGDVIVGEAGSASYGLIQSGALEASNVDIAAELINLITAQRNFQANAQVITTADTVTQTIINIR